ncbi:hypothetical protein J6500_22630 [Bradyrhizobium sp. WSM 1704]|uniref:hypothetical protein n=1 Tax=Bradyrhizobium semiaridum TaxID=2821404 RepID=UPI001CE24F28|nr:hypothetical protein [Bradyrhizobium semiaridum]MCA6124665.1 hypothetical protein [Bradyrhizobium semiaridum]
MQTLALRQTSTFDYAIDLVKGFAHSIVELVTAPIERIARASDVAGVLEQRRANRRAPRPAVAGGGRCSQRNCPMSPFGNLGELT